MLARHVPADRTPSQRGQRGRQSPLEHRPARGIARKPFPRQSVSPEEATDHADRQSLVEALTQATGRPMPESVAGARSSVTVALFLSLDVHHDVHRLPVGVGHDWRRAWQGSQELFEIGFLKRAPNHRCFTA